MPRQDAIKRDNPRRDLLISYLTLRKAVGLLGMLLPLILTLGMFLLSDCNTFQDSISDYYYTRMGHVLVGVLCAVGLFLFTYKGYEKRDEVASKLGCLFALGVAFFPTYGPDASRPCNFLHRNSSPTTSIIHGFSATLLFLTFAYFSLVLFVKTSGHPTRKKLKRNKIYRACGYIILGCILLIFLYSVVPMLHSIFERYKPIYIFETIALWAFGFSWITKGEFILKDR